ncbi:hypothetical protein GCM10023322_58790 [Rugosimonospora acidiphila]|uniref:Tetratricopeptide repeat protein n=1 Tax=Rugosimonospora acidiphila TaxID=556531 RepID=A0ABP9SFR5_9ACTN
MGPELAQIWELVEAGDVQGVLRGLRPIADTIGIEDLARVMGRVAGVVGFTDLVDASAAVAADPANPIGLYDFGYGCVEHGVAYLAVPALSAALRAAPESRRVLTELVAALESEYRHQEAVTLLAEREPTLRDWPERYLLVFNAIMAGRLDVAARHFERLTEPEDRQWAPARERVRHMLDRAALARTVRPLDGEDLRGWHFVVGGGVLATLSPYGFQHGMTGRYAYLQDDYGHCLRGLHRLRLILRAAGRRPATVSLLPDRSSQILGRAAAELFGLPAVPFDPSLQDTVVVAYDLSDVDQQSAAALRERAPGQVLFEQATCWTQPPAVTADVSGLLSQFVVPPWGERLGGGPDNEVSQEPADDRPVETLAAQVLGADPKPDTGDGETPEDSDESLSAFVAGLRDLWLTGPRDRMRSPGPVRSSRFA